MSTIICKSKEECVKEQLDIEREFFASMVHEIRTPMNAILGFLELLELEIDDKNQKEYLRSARNSGSLITTLVNDILDISKIESGKMSIENHLFSLVDLAQEIGKLFYYSTQRDGIHFSSYFDPKIPYMIDSDPHRLKQIINNFMSNAIKFTPQDGDIELRFIYNEEDDSVKISVSDSGIGIPSDDLYKIFSRYEQSSTTTASKHGGTGLGLAISKQLATLLSGEIAVKSVEGSGSSFGVTTPANSLSTMIPTVDSAEFKSVTLVLVESSNSSKEHTYAMDIIKSYCDRLSIDYTFVDGGDRKRLMELAQGNICIIDSSTINQNNRDAIQEMVDIFEHKIMFIESKTLLSGIKFDNIPIVERPLLPNKIFDTLLSIMDGSNVEKSASTKDNKYEKPSKSLNILVVDDNYINLKLMCEVVKKFHHNSFIARDGVEALEIYKNSEIDIVFIDYQMPNMNGVESIREMKKIQKNNKTKFYALTGYQDSTLIEEMKSAGADDILTKPVSIDRLISLFSRYS